MKAIRIISLSLLTLLTIPAIAQAGPLQRRLNNQNKRIYHGVNNGSLTYKEFKRLEQRGDRLEVQRRKQIQDGGGLTPKEFVRFNRKLNKQSKQIYRQKHD